MIHRMCWIEDIEAQYYGKIQSEQLQQRNYEALL